MKSLILILFALFLTFSSCEDQQLRAPTKIEVIGSNIDADIYIIRDLGSGYLYKLSSEELGVVQRGGGNIVTYYEKVICTRCQNGTRDCCETQCEWGACCWQIQC